MASIESPKTDKKLPFYTLRDLQQLFQMLSEEHSLLQSGIRYSSYSSLASFGPLNFYYIFRYPDVEKILFVLFWVEGLFKFLFIDLREVISIEHFKDISPSTPVFSYKQAISKCSGCNL